MLKKSKLIDIVYSIISIGLCVCLGKLIAYLIGMLPSSLFGLLCFTLLLHVKIISADRVKSAIEWALSNMGLCFVPAGVGIINHFDLIKNHGLSIVLIIVISTLALLTFVGIFFQNYMNNPKRNQTEQSNK